MLNINLLPEQLRKPEPSAFEQIHRMPLTSILLGIMVLVTVALGVVVRFRTMELQKLNEQVLQLQPKKTVVDQLQRQIQKLEEEEKAYSQLSMDFLWAKRFSQLSAVIPDGLWFTDFVWAPLEGLKLTGVTIQEDGAEMSKISRLVQDLKSDAKFGADLEDIKIDSIKRIQDKDIELVSFTLVGKPAELQKAKP